MNEPKSIADHSSPTWLAAAPWVVPLVIYLVAGFFEPKFASPANISPQKSNDVMTLPAFTSKPDAALVQRYIAINVTKCLCTGVSILAFWRVYHRSFPLNVDALAIALGIVGAALWIGICALSLEQQFLGGFGRTAAALGKRSGFDPFSSIDSALWRGVFFVARFGLLAIIVPIAEELFLRGFLMRFIQDVQWPKVDLAKLGLPALVAGTVYGVIAHPSEAFAALIWFSLISWLMLRTGKFWNCVLAHAITNALLGAYAVYFAQWQLW